MEDQCSYQFVNWLRQTYGDEFDPQEVIVRDIREWKAYQQTVEKASPNTINQRLVAIGRFFSWAHAEYIIQMNPAADLDLINVSDLKPKGLDGKSLRQLLRAVHKYGSQRDIAVVELLIGTGLRVSELLWLSVGDIEIRERFGKVTVRKGKQTLITNDIESDERISFKNQLLAAGVKSILCVPLVSRGSAIGLLGLCLPDKEDMRILKDTGRLITTFAGQAAIAIENTRLYEELEDANEQIIEWNEFLQQRIDETTENMCPRSMSP